MTKQPEALQLADALVSDAVSPIDLKAAAELRRLHAVNAELLRTLQEIKLKCTSLADAQVTALQALAPKPPSDYRDWDYQEHKQSFGHHLGTNAVTVTWPKL